jgi:hypothetical protein
MLPCRALVAGDPRLARVFFLFCGSANASDDFFFWFWFFCLGFLAFLPAPRWCFDGLELLERLRVLSLGGSDRPPGFSFA